MIFTLAFLPLYVLTVTVAVPSAMPVTVPSAPTVAYFLLDVHFKSLCAVSGLSVAASCSVSPLFSTTVPVRSRLTPVGLYGSSTLIFTLAFLPFCDVTVIVAVPSATPVTVPSAPTVAYFAAEDFQPSLASASSGNTVQFSFSVSPLFSDTVPLRSRDRDCTYFGAGSGVVRSTPALPPSASTMRGSLAPL